MFVLFSFFQIEKTFRTVHDRPNALNSTDASHIGWMFPRPDSLRRSPKATQNETKPGLVSCGARAVGRSPAIPTRLCSSRPNSVVFSDSSFNSRNENHACRRRVGIAAGLQPRRSEGSIPSRCASFPGFERTLGAHVPQGRCCLASSVRRVQAPSPPPFFQ